MYVDLAFERPTIVCEVAHETGRFAQNPCALEEELSILSKVASSAYLAKAFSELKLLPTFSRIIGKTNLKYKEGLICEKV